MLLMAALTIVGCGNKHKESAGIYDYHETDGFTHADSIIDAASDSRDYDYMLAAIDSLNDLGELSKPKYIFYRTITLNLLNQQSTSLKLYYQLDTLDLKELKTETDIESYVYSYNNYSDYVGHGIGREMHEDPEVPNYYNPRARQRLHAGMAIAVEPMINLVTMITANRRRSIFTTECSAPKPPYPTRTRIRTGFRA